MEGAVVEELPVTTIVGWAGFIIGILFGAISQRSNFCIMGSVADAVSFGSFTRARSWILAVAVAMIGAQTLHYFEFIDLSSSIYLNPSLNWAGMILGGLIFGFGMVLASGCPGRNLVLAGGGNIKAFVVLIFIGLFGYMTLRGLTGLGRVALEAATAVDLTERGLDAQGVQHFLAGGGGKTASQWGMGVMAVVVLLLLWFIFKDSQFRRSRLLIFAGIGIGFLDIAGWWATGILGADDFDPTPLGSLTFIAPTGESLQYLMTFSGATINFGIASIGGALFGAFLSAITSRQFAVRSFSDTADTIRHLAGAALMGVGGISALGCTIGQGITGVSTLAVGSILATISIVTGGFFGVKYLERALDI